MKLIYRNLFISPMQRAIGYAIGACLAIVLLPLLLAMYWKKEK